MNEEFLIKEINERFFPGDPISEIIKNVPFGTNKNVKVTENFPFYDVWYEHLKILTSGFYVLLIGSLDDCMNVFTNQIKPYRIV